MSRGGRRRAGRFLWALGWSGVGMRVLAWDSSPHTPVASLSRTGTHTQLQRSGSMALVPVGGGTRGCGCHQCWSWAQAYLSGHPALLPHPRRAKPVNPQGWVGICARWAGVYEVHPEPARGDILPVLPQGDRHRTGSHRWQLPPPPPHLISYADHLPKGGFVSLEVLKLTALLHQVFWLEQPLCLLGKLLGTVLLRAGCGLHTADVC